MEEEEVGGGGGKINRESDQKENILSCQNGSVCVRACACACACAFNCTEVYQYLYKNEALIINTRCQTKKRKRRTGIL